jgi:AICAR transformylase/IMP cyclohydrolase PurH
MRTVLVSVSDKSGLESFLRKMEKFDKLRLIATGNTAKFLSEHGFSVVKVEELTKFPEILAGRVKTLHPKVFAGILSRPLAEDRTCLQEHDIEEIDVVVVNLYPFEKKLEEGLTEPEMIEQIDIGGVTLLRAAAKNFARVTRLNTTRSRNRWKQTADSSPTCCANSLPMRLSSALRNTTGISRRTLVGRCRLPGRVRRKVWRRM